MVVAVGLYLHLVNRLRKNSYSGYRLYPWELMVLPSIFKGILMADNNDIIIIIIDTYIARYALIAQSAVQ